MACETPSWGSYSAHGGIRCPWWHSVPNKNCYFTKIIFFVIGAVACWGHEWPFSFLHCLPVEGCENQVRQLVPMLQSMQVHMDANKDQAAKPVPKGARPVSCRGCSSLGTPWDPSLCPSSVRDKPRGTERREKQMTSNVYLVKVEEDCFS